MSSEPLELPEFDVDIDVLKASIDLQIQRLRRNQYRDKRRATTVTLIAAFGSAATTTFIGLSK